MDDHKLFAEAIRSTLESEGMEVLELAETGEEAISRAISERPDLALVDLALPDVRGVEVGKRILAECPGAVVLAVTSIHDSSVVQEVMREGFHGYLTKSTPMVQFLKGIQSALGGQVVIPHRLASRAAGHRSRDQQEAELLLRQLTPREFEVLTMLAQGQTGEQMAKQLSISKNTVRSHVQNILTKLQVHSRLEAAAFAVRNGVVRGGSRPPSY
ncbi:MAG: response regulator transcription factor [Actinomycetota bacterium]|nr:response regulator transcription factor [Actinomycetota bacterium]